MSWVENLHISEKKEFNETGFPSLVMETSCLFRFVQGISNINGDLYEQLPHVHTVNSRIKATAYKREWGYFFSLKSKGVAYKRGFHRSSMIWKVIDFS